MTTFYILTLCCVAEKRYLMSKLQSFVKYKYIIIYYIINKKKKKTQES